MRKSQLFQNSLLFICLLSVFISCASTNKRKKVKTKQTEKSEVVQETSTANRVDSTTLIHKPGVQNPSELDSIKKAKSIEKRRSIEQVK